MQNKQIRIKVTTTKANKYKETDRHNDIKRFRQKIGSRRQYESKTKRQKDKKTKRQKDKKTKRQKDIKKQKDKKKDRDKQWFKIQ
jgi:hypothetical protein